MVNRREHGDDARGIELRSMAGTDIPAIVRLLNELAEFATTFAQFDPQTVTRTFTAMSTNPGIYRNFVAEKDGTVVGLLTMVCYRSLFHRVGTVLINELIVSRKVRGSGIGTLLLSAAQSLARDEGYDEIEVGTERANRRAIEFYQKNGFNEEYVLLGREY